MGIEPLSYMSKALNSYNEKVCEAGLLLSLLLIHGTLNYTCKVLDLVTLSKWLNSLLFASLSSSLPLK